MKFSCNTADLLTALQLVNRAIGNQQALPILGNVLVEAEGSVCTLSATDLELSIITTFPAKIETEGRITIPAKAIVNFAQYNTDTEVIMETTGESQVRCVSKHAKTMIAGESANDYPTITVLEKQQSFTLEIDSFLRALHLVTFASARTSLRPVLSGVYIRGEESKIIMVATDSYRLSEYRIPASGIGAELSCIIPTKILDEVKVILGSAKSDKKGSKNASDEKPVEHSVVTAEVILSRQQVEFRIGNTRLLSRLIDGKFPPYEQIIPKECQTKVVFSIDELTPAVRRMHYFAKEINNNLTFSFEKEQTRIATPQTQVGKDEATLTAQLEGNENKIALSSSYLLDFLGHIDGETVRMEMSDSQRPAIFRLPDESDFLHLIMPLRMQES